MNTVQEENRIPSIVGVNVLYLVAMVLLVTLGIAVQQGSPGWGLVITELVVILAPALVFLRVRRLPVRETLRWRWPGWDVALLCLLIGVGLWFFDAVLDSVMAQVFGYAPQTTAQPGTMPTHERLGLILGLAILAPLCEEVLFRGVIQRGHERRGPWRGVLVGGLLFALYHLRFQGLVALLPIAAVLGYAFWRSQSLIAAMLIHFANNALGAITIVLQALDPTFDLTSLFLTVAGPAVAIGSLALWLFHRRTREVTRPLPPPTAAGTRWRVLPLAAAIGIYLVFAGLELAYARFPEVLAREELALGSSPWTEPMTWTYELRLQATDQVVGSTTCEVTPSGSEIRLACTLEQTEFDIREGNSRWIGDDVTQTTTARWSVETLRLEEAELRSEWGGGLTVVEVTRPEDSLVLTTNEGQVLSIPDDALLVAGGIAQFLAGEAPWRLSGMPFEAGTVRKATLAEALRWQTELEGLAPNLEDVAVIVEGPEVLELPGGETPAWRVSWGEGRTAWYAEAAPHALVQYETGMLRWVLVEP